MAGPKYAMRKQVAKLKAREVDSNKRNDTLEGELAVERVSRAAAEAEVES